jgi:hypothetical protein
MLLTARRDDRARMMADRHITPEDIAEARDQLQLTIEDDEELSNVLDSLLPRDQSSGTPPIAAQNHNSADAETGYAPEPASTTDEASEESAPAEATLEENEPPAPPPVDFSAVTMLDAQPGSLSPRASPHPGGGGRGSVSGAPTLRTEEEKRRIGKRGEEVAWRRERERLRQLGKNPDLAVWVSKTDELAPFDIKSVDEDDQLLYIEVKSTNSDDPGEPFYISRAELVEATFHRSRYYIYRVTNVDTAAPTIIRAADPMRLVREGKGRLLLNNAHMTLAFGSPTQSPEDTPRFDSGS